MKRNRRARAWAASAIATLMVAGGIAAAINTAPAFAAGCSGVAVTTSSNIQNLINSNPSGTTFCFASGTYANADSLSPKANDVFDGNGQGAVLDGGNSRQFAFLATGSSPTSATNLGPAGVTVQSFKIQNYATPLQWGVIEDHGGSGWTIQNNDIEHNAAAAVATGDGDRVLNNKLDNNQQEGFSAHGTGGFYQGNDISGNNSACNSDPSHGPWSGWEAGAGKAAFSTSLSFVGNTVTNNGGNGLWMDTDNYGTIVQQNLVTGNGGAGIYEEDSYNFQITGNDVEGNSMSGTPCSGSGPGYAFGAGIQDRRSGCINGATCIIQGNTVYDNYNGIDLIESPASQPPGNYGNYDVQNVSVTYNGVTATQGALTGAWQDGAGNNIFTTFHNTWDNNAYCVSAATHPSDGYTYGWFGWNNGWSDPIGPASLQYTWQWYGQDLHGTQTVTTSKCLPPTTSAVTYDNTSAAGNAAQSSLSWTHTVGSGNNRALLVEFSVGEQGAGDGGCVTTVNDGSTAMTRLATVHTGNQAAGYLTVWGLANPPSGANTITGTVSGCNGGTPVELTGGGESFSGVSQTSPWSAVTTAYSSPSGSGTASAARVSTSSQDLMAAFTADGSGGETAQSPLTSRFVQDVDQASGAGNSAGATAPATGSSVTATWTMTPDLWAVALLEVQHA